MSTVTYAEFPRANEVVVAEEALPARALAAEEALITSEASIISTGTELARLRGLGEASFPARPGYGMVGTITAAGADLTGFAVGQRVFFAGKHASQQYFRHAQGHQWGHLFPVPDGLDPVDACVACMAQIALTAPTITELRLRETVAVFGLGLVGILAARLYQLRGARVLGVDPVAERCRLAQEVGIGETCQVAPAEQAEAVRAWAGGEGPGVTCDATGLSPAVATAIASVAPFGQVVLLGSPRAPWQSDTTAILSRIHTEGLVVRGAHMWRFPTSPDRNVRESVERNFQTVFACIADGSLPVRRLISHVIAPAEIPAAYRGLAEDPETYTGVVIDWRRGR